MKMIYVISVMVMALALAQPAFAGPRGGGSRGGGGYHGGSSGGYHPPSNGGYHPPSGGGYHPPSGGGYHPPSGGGYHPPSGGGYHPPSGGYHAPGNGSVGPRPGQVYHNGNVVTVGHTTRIERSNYRSTYVMRNDYRVNTFVTNHYNVYVGYRPYFTARYDLCTGYYTRWGVYYSPWYRYGFYGGFYYPFYPVYDIQVHFWNPIVFWLYADAWDDYYYHTWYGSDYYSTPALQVHFQRPGVFYPTTEIRDLALGISSMPVREQGNFRVGMIDLASKLEQKLSEGLATPVALGRNDIVVNHYQMLESAVVLEGFVSADARQFPFKALLDLNDPAMNLVFVPASADGQPTDAQLFELRALNERIVQLGGTVEYGTAANVADRPAPTPAPVVVPAPQGRRGD